jgi:hypothetical protein
MALTIGPVTATSASWKVMARATIWKGQSVLRVSIISPATTQSEIENLADAIGRALQSHRIRVVDPPT